MKEIIFKQFNEIYETVFYVEADDILFAIDKKDNLIKPFPETQQYREFVIEGEK